MIACFHGYRTDLANLRGRFSLSMKGANLAQITGYASTLNLAARALRTELDELRYLKTPCILHWDFNHFVVLRKVRGDTVFIHDPATGVRTLPLEVAGKHFTGVALELAPTTEFKQADVKRKVSLRSLIGKVAGLWTSLGMVLAMAIALELFGLVAPMFNQWIVDEAMVSGDRPLLNVLVLGFGLMLVIQTAVSVARGWTLMYLCTHLNLQWAANVFSHLLHLPMRWFEKRHLGDVVSRFGSIGTIQRTLTTTSIAAILDGLMAVATIAVMFFYSPNLSIVVLVAVTLYGGLRAAAYGPLRRAGQEGLILAAKEQSYFLETIRAVQAIKLFGRELDRRGRWLNLMVDSINRGVRSQKLMLGFGIANTFVFGMVNLTLFWLGARMVLDHAFTLGMLFAFTSYAGQFSGRMSSLIDKYVEFKMLSLHGERLADIVLEETEEEVAQPDLPLDTLPARIELIDVGFRYSDGDAWVLRHVNLTVEAGEAMALVGPSGCGKTTLIKLILGLLVPNEGEIRYGGVPVHHLGNRAYRSVIGVVMQNDQLMAGSLADNISFFDAEKDTARIETCARMAAVHDDIAAMPMGYHTLTGDMGTTLSGGQKQRILLARALYRAPKVLVLDEATSHLDVERERHVNQAIGSLAITRICVAHRPETIAMAEREVRMMNGAITEVRARAAVQAELCFS
jgi:ATP-binding cassette subfamily B protein RaxB